MKVQFKNIYNSKKGLMFTIKTDTLTDSIIIYVFDEKEKGLIRSLSIKRSYLNKILSK